MAAINDKRSTVVGVFEDRQHALAAIRDLYNAGFPENRIGIAATGSAHDLSKVRSTGDATAEPGTATATGAFAGAVAGASVGGLVGLGIMAGMVPVIGPVIAGGTLAALLANAAGGATVGGLLGLLMGQSYPEEEARYYQAEFEAGRTIVTVDAGSRAMDAISIISLNGGYNLDTRASRAPMTTASAGSRGKVTAATGIETGQGSPVPR
jgi:hypothetical protein